MDYKIEKNIKIPDGMTYPFPKMEVEDSFFIPKDKIRKVRPAASWYATKHGVKFKIWAFGEGYRCWRVK